MNSGLFKMTSPFFSIIIPTYNSGKTLSACLESILNQTFQNFEIIIIDGVSSDNTISIVKHFEEKNQNIRWVSKKDDGIYDAMNKGVRMAKGEWLYFLGSDDRLYNLEVLYKIEQKLNTEICLDVIYGDVYSTRFNGIYDGEFSNEKMYNQNLCHQSIFFRKSVFKKIGYFDLKYKGHADWDHNIKWFLSKKIRKKYVNIIIADYADGGFSSMNGDNLFIEDKGLKYVLYGYKSLPFNYKYPFIKNEIKKSLKNKEYTKAIVLALKSPFILL